MPELALERAITLADEGATWALTVDGVTRRFDDESRACEDRAAKAAVVIALDAQAAPAVPIVPVVVPVAPAPPPAPPRSRPSSPTDDMHLPSIQLEARGILALAPAQSASVTGGGGLRLFAGGRHLGVVIGVAGLAPDTLTFAKANARLWRVPVDLGLRGRLFVRRVALSLDAAVVLGPQITQGLDLMRATRQTRLEVGLSGTARAEYWVTRRIAPLLEVGVEGTLRSYDLSVPSVGVVGHPPRAWLSIAAGLAIRLR